MGGIILAVTIKDIAKECGVSRQSVSYALTGTGRLSQATRERIIEVARRLGYRPNSIARTMRTGRFNAATLLLSTDAGTGQLPSPLLGGIHDGLQAHDMHLTLARISGDQLREPDHAPKLIREWASDGLLVNCVTEGQDQLTALLERYAVPAIWLNTVNQGDSISADNLGGGSEATRRLMAMGHRRIGVACYEESVHEGEIDCNRMDRYRGCAQVMGEQGLEPVILGGTSPVAPADAITYSTQWLSQPDRPTAVLACSHVEMAAIMRAAWLAKLRIPEDLSLVTFTCASLEQKALGLTSVILPQYELGRQAVGMLLQKIDQPQVVQPPRTVPCEWRDGATIGPPPG